MIDLPNAILYAYLIFHVVAALGFAIADFLEGRKTYK